MGGTTLSKVEKLYSEKLMSAEDAVKFVQSNDNIIFPTGAGEPPALMEALAQRKEELFNVSISQILPLKAATYLSDPSYAPHIRHNAWFVAGVTRKAANEGWTTITPNYYHEIPRLIECGFFPVDIVMATVSPMDQHGYFSFSCGICYTTTAVKKARVIILEVNKNAPRSLGNSFIHVSDVSAIIESDTALPALKIPPITETEQTIGNYIAELIPDGATLQIGFGGVPNAVCNALLSKKDLGIHTEMITDGMVDLVISGAVNCSKKTFHPGKMLGTFILGTERLYSFVNDNPMIEMHAVSYTNDPVNIGKNDNMCTVNASIEVDFLGQCASESMGTFFWSGTGGQADFGHGANISKGGKGFIAIPSTAKKGTVSRIVPTLTPGTAVTTSKNSVDHIVTEYGVVRLRGKSISERAKALISIAHPDFRDELTYEAKKRNLI